eukprot:CAMPEP_0194435202 /NCGR_PEP_ID=MMETSP0176-20130528/87277_1 /TAXON_ID=216777 /ORGANISM="Proboscia alata, Strain PI-D3" /LENGTH=88 /DNA_ID=CAMNT_0039254223 /DNA_START=65 /DNA_END=328 /DNA_ORIENTATION=-
MIVRFTTPAKKDIAPIGFDEGICSGFNFMIWASSALFLSPNSDTEDTAFGACNVWEKGERVSKDGGNDGHESGASGQDSGSSGVVNLG